MVAAALLSSLLLAASPAAAAVHGCGGHQLDTGCNNILRRQVSNEDAIQNCVYYADAVRDPIVSEFPGLWAAADILPNDTVAQAIFDPINAEVQQKFPNIQPGGTAQDVSSVPYDDATDPNCWWTRTKCSTPSPDTGLQPDVTTLPEPETWGLGIDDGPNCTNSVLYDFFKSQDPPIKASLYYIGSNVLNWPKQARRAVEDGHQICVHTWSHPSMTSRTNSQAFAELYYTRLIIQKILGRTPLCWRPPLGDVDNRIRFIASKLNLTLHLWSDDTFDWMVGTQNVTMDTIAQNYQKVFSQAQAGDYKTHGPIVLNHEVNNNTMSMMIQQFPNIKANFKHIVPIASGLNITNPYVEQNITFPTFAELTGESNGTAAASNDSAASGTAAGASGSASAGAAGAAAAASVSAKPSGASRSLTASAGVVAAGLLAAVLL